MKKNNRAFTLLEIMVMIGILALLAALTINKISGIFDHGQEAVARIFVQDTLKTPLERYRMDIGSYPTTAEGLAVLLTAPATTTGTWRGPYVEKQQPDPWGEQYQYRYPGTHNKTSYDVFTKGPDKAEGTADDIGNW